MRNPHRKPRDLARSALASTSRRNVRELRAIAHGNERARVRARLHELRNHLDPDDYDGDLHYRALGDLDQMIGARRSHDKLGPLFRWAQAHVERDPGIADATPIDKVHHFTQLLPNDLSGRHALSHLRWELGAEHSWFLSLPLARPAAPPDPLDAEVEAIVAAGLHGELNRRIRSAATTANVQGGMDTADPGPVAARRYLAGGHDITAFADDADDLARQVIEGLHAELASGR
jgi:hypothetical protein